MHVIGHDARKMSIRAFDKVHPLPRADRGGENFSSKTLVTTPPQPSKVHGNSCYYPPSKVHGNSCYYPPSKILGKHWLLSPGRQVGAPVLHNLRLHHWCCRSCRTWSRSARTVPKRQASVLWHSCLKLGLFSGRYRTPTSRCRSPCRRVRHPDPQTLIRPVSKLSFI